MIKVALLSGVMALGFTGCGEMITLEKQDNGAMAYMLNHEIKLPVNKGGTYNRYKIHRYRMNFKEVNGIVTVSVIHAIDFTTGSGVPFSGSLNPDKTTWLPSRFYHKPKSFDIVGLRARNHVSRVTGASFVFDSWSETIKTRYSKRNFIKFFKNKKNVKVKVRFRNETKTVYIPSMDKIHKYVKCLENKASCGSK